MTSGNSGEQHPVHQAYADSPDPAPPPADPWLADFPGRLADRADGVSAAVARYLHDGDREALATALDALEAIVTTAQVARYRLAERASEERGTR